MHSNGSKQQLFQRDDIIQLGSKLEQQSFNVIAHKRLKKSKPIVTQNSHSIAQTLKTLQMQTIEGTGQSYLNMDSESKVIEQDKLVPRKGRINTSNSYFRSNSKAKNNLKDKIRFNQTITVKSQSLNDSEVASDHTNKKSLPFNDFGQSGDKMSLSKIIERQFNRGPLKQRHLMNWLNQIFVEYCFSSDFEKGELKALERFGLDQNTLLSRGINGAQITRLYKSLFVYSIGFNNLLKDISNNNKSVKKSIWKTYIILLEYCSQGNFQTTMGELQRDMIQNEQRLIKQIQVRQAQIDNNQEIMQGRLHKYIKENKELTIKVKTLQEKNEILEKQFREMEVAYNMEVSLRLAYQYKINEIYSVHEKLNILHLNLYKDFQEKTEQNKKLDRQCWTAKQGASELKAYNQQILGILSDLQHQLNLSENMLEGLRLNQQQLNEKLYEQTRQKRNQVVQLRQKQKKIVQLQRTLGSSNLIVDMMKSTSNSHYVQYKRLTMQNSDLRRVKEGQVQKIQQLLNDIKYLNSKESSLKNQIQHAQNKISQLYEKIKGLEDNIDKLTKKYDEKQIQYRTKCVELDGQLKLSISLENSNKQTKIMFQRLQQENKVLKKYSQEINGRYTKTHQDLLVSQLQCKALQQSKFQLQLEINKRVNEILSLKKKYESENSMQTNHFQKLHKIWSEQDDIQQNLTANLQNTKKQLQAANLRICFLSQQFTDLNFQKSKIQGLYKDNLILHDREKKAEKDLMIKMSKMTEQIERSNRQMEVISKTSQQNINRITKQKQQAEKELDNTRLALRKKQGFVHPMLLQDALQTLQREIENHYSTRILLQNQIQKERQTIYSLKIELQKKENNFRHNVMELQKRVQKMQNQLKGQRQYFQEKSTRLNSLVYELETKLNEKTIEVERAENNSAQNKFMNLMKQKNSQIQQLLSELQRIQDNYTEKCANYENEIQHIHKQRQNVITELKESKKELEGKVIQIQKNYQQKLIEKQKEKEQIIQQLLEQKTLTENDNEQNEQNTDKNQNKRMDFIRRLKFANIYYKK